MEHSAILGRVRSFAALLLSFVLVAACMVPTAVFAQDSDEAAHSGNAANSNRTVRVGWYESPFNSTDQFGRRSGYAYEYQRKIAAYTGWSYEYVEGSWPELLQMLKNGEIDLLSDVSYTDERAGDMLFDSLPMGTEAYYLFISSEGAGIDSQDYSSLDGKKVGVNQGSLQKDLFLEWEQAHGVQAQIIELTSSVEESLQKVRSGELDALVTLDSDVDPESETPVWKIGSSDFFFAVNKNRPDLLTELDAAMSRLQDENRYYSQKLYEKYFKKTQADPFLSSDELAWLSRHGTIRVGYQDDYLAFCAKDETTGELIGALKDCLDYASTGMGNAHLDFEAIAYPTAAAALEALNNGEVDCMFPVNLTDYDGEVMGVSITPPLMRTEMDAVVRAADQKEFIRKQPVTVAVNQGNTNYEMFLLDNYPGWQVKYFPDTPAGLEGVAAGEADCVIISNYRFNNISKQCKNLHLTTVYTGVDMDYCLAVREGDTELYSILTRVTGMVPDSVVHAALTYYSTEDVKLSFFDFIRDNLGVAMAVVAAVLLVIILLLLRSIRAERRASEEEHLVDDLNKRVFVDALTSVRNKGAFDDYIESIQEKINRGEQIEFGIGVFDCNDLKSINDQHGHDKGDEYLKAASKLICRVFQHSPVFRIGGDEFAVVLQNDDLRNRESLVAEFNERQKEISESAANDWEEVHVALGAAVFDQRVDQSAADVLRRADKIMYENKRLGKLQIAQNGGNDE